MPKLIIMDCGDGLGPMKEVKTIDMTEDGKMKPIDKIMGEWKKGFEESFNKKDDSDSSEEEDDDYNLCYSCEKPYFNEEGITLNDKAGESCYDYCNSCYKEQCDTPFCQELVGH
jgi:hypothetical protein